MDIQPYPDRQDVWQGHEDGREYFIELHRSQYGPSWSVKMLIVPASDQKPYWRTVKNWQRFACEVRAFKNSN